jgi:hypothetical protein
MILPSFQICRYTLQTRGLVCLDFVQGEGGGWCGSTVARVALQRYIVSSAAVIIVLLPVSWICALLGAPL